MYKQRNPAKPPGFLQNCGRLPLWLLRRSKRPITALGVSPYDNVRHASPVSAQLAADPCFLRYGKEPMFRSPNTWYPPNIVSIPA
jgi:hypothetical protein